MHSRPLLSWSQSCCGFLSSGQSPGLKSAVSFRPVHMASCFQIAPEFARMAVAGPPFSSRLLPSPGCSPSVLAPKMPGHFSPFISQAAASSLLFHLSHNIQTEPGLSPLSLCWRNYGALFWLDIIRCPVTSQEVHSNK